MVLGGERRGEDVSRSGRVDLASRPERVRAPGWLAALVHQAAPSVLGHHHQLCQLGVPRDHGRDRHVVGAEDHGVRPRERRLGVLPLDRKDLAVLVPAAHPALRRDHHHAAGEGVQQARIDLLGQRGQVHDRRRFPLFGNVHREQIGGPAEQELRPSILVILVDVRRGGLGRNPQDPDRGRRLTQLIAPDQGVHEQRLEIGAGQDPHPLPELPGRQRRVRCRAAEDVPLLEEVHGDVPDRQVVNLAKIGPDVRHLTLTLALSGRNDFGRNDFGRNDFGRNDLRPYSPGRGAMNCAPLRRPLPLGERGCSGRRQRLPYPPNRWAWRGETTTRRLSPSPTLWVETPGMIGQRHVDHSALGRHHRIEEDRLAVALGSVGGPHRDVAQQPRPALAVPFGVEDHPDPTLGLAAGEQAGQELERPEGLPAPADQDAAVLAVDAQLHGGQALLNLGAVHLDVALEVHAVQQLLQNGDGSVGRGTGLGRDLDGSGTARATWRRDARGHRDGRRVLVLVVVFLVLVV